MNWKQNKLSLVRNPVRERARRAIRNVRIEIEGCKYQWQPDDVRLSVRGQRLEAKLEKMEAAYRARFGADEFSRHFETRLLDEIPF